MIDWPETLVSDIARRRCVIFLGAGVSKNSTNEHGVRPKLWTELLRSLLENIRPNQHIRSLINKYDLLTACEVIKDSMGDNDFYAAMRNEYLTPRFNHADIHSQILKLDSRIVITPNFDKIYETYANTQLSGAISVKQHCDRDVVRFIRESEPTIIKIHGSIDSAHSMVFTRNEYARARSEYSEFYDAIKALFITHTFLFIGCGIDDPDVRLLLEDIAFQHPHSKPHYFTLPNRAIHSSVESALRRSMNLSLIKYKPDNFHEELTTSLQNLVTLVEQQRLKVAERQSW